MQTSPKKLPPSPKKQATKSKSLLPDSYLEILGSETLVNTQKEKTVEPDEIAQLISDKQKTLVRAMKAANDGDAEEASYLFRLHATMIIPQSNPVTSERRVKTIPMTRKCHTHIDLTEEDKIDEEEKPFVENGITFMPGTLYLHYRHCKWDLTIFGLKQLGRVPRKAATRRMASPGKKV